MFESDQINVSLNNKGIDGSAHPMLDEYLAGSPKEKTETSDLKSGVDNSRSCPDSPVYRKIINAALSTMFDPARLGEPSEVLSKYNCEIEDGKSPVEMADKALAGVEDPYTDLLTNKELGRHSDLRKGEYKGIGAIFTGLTKPGTDNELGSVVVSKLASDTSPAKLAGLRRGDIVTSIDGKSTEGKNPMEVVDMIRAASDKGLSVGVLRDGRSLEFQMKKDRIEYPAVRDRLLPDKNIAYISIDTFYKSSAAAELIAAVSKYPKVDGFILDLRGNQGGTDRNFLYSASLFVDEGVLFRTVTRRPGSPYSPEYDVKETTLTKDRMQTTQYDQASGKQNAMSYVSRRVPDLVDQPVVILMNGGSYSAAEAFAAALRDNGAASIIGTKSGGKGIGQMFYPLPGIGALKLTSFKTFTPAGRWLGDAVNNRHGLEPDIKVEMDNSVLSGGPKDPQMNAAIDHLTSKKKAR